MVIKKFPSEKVKSMKSANEKVDYLIDHMVKGIKEGLRQLQNI